MILMHISFEAFLFYYLLGLVSSLSVGWLAAAATTQSLLGGFRKKELNIAACKYC